jgi:RNA polymerase sigma-70 factor (ECF subfamily)
MQTLAAAPPRHRLMDFLERTYDTFGAKLYHYLLGILRSAADAEDALQTVFVKLAQRERDDEIDDLTSYLFSAARNEAIRIRGRKRPNVETPEEAPDRRPLPPELLQATEDREVDRRRLEAALAGLPEEQREVVLLKVWEGLTFREIAQVLGVPQDTAASRYRYALEKLKTTLGE